MAHTLRCEFGVAMVNALRKFAFAITLSLATFFFIYPEAIDCLFVLSLSQSAHQTGLNCSRSDIKPLPPTVFFSPVLQPPPSKYLVVTLVQ